MIPKIIHYCWFGKKDKTELAKKCIASWKEKLPDYQIIEWNEDNFDVKKLKFTREAYKIGKYAFVADVARLYALYHIGGIYLDTDVEVINNFNIFLTCKSFIGYEVSPPNSNIVGLQTAVIGAEKNNKLIYKFLSYYNDKKFILKNRQYNVIPNVKIITDYLVRNERLNLSGKYQVLDNITIFPVDYFCPYNPYKKNLYISENTICIHHFSGSWCYVIPKKHFWLVNIIGEEKYRKLGKIKQCFFKYIKK